MHSELIDKELCRVIAENSVMWINILDKDANIIMWNRAAERISGYKKEEVLGKNDIWEWLYPNEEYRGYIFKKALEIINSGKEVIDFETTITCKNGINRIMSWNSTNIKDEDGNVIGSIAMARDVSKIKDHEYQLELLTIELKESNHQLHKLSYIDQLTNIPNRRAYEEKIFHEISSVKRSGKEMSVFMIDIDNFKEYNDYYGHECGDDVLHKVANKIRSILPRETDFIARYGGEELVVILPFTPIEKTKKVAQNILEAIHSLNIEHIYSNFNNILTVSIGIASTKENIDDLIYSADKALYRAKQNGRNRFEV